MVLNQGRCDDACIVYQRATFIDEETLGPDHPTVAATIRNLAELHREQGAMFKAKLLLERALFILEKAHGPDHCDVAETLSLLGELLQVRARQWQALEWDLRQQEEDRFHVEA